MIIISHDRHFLNQVCTHMADMDYGKLTVYPGNYDNYMEASTMSRAQKLKDNEKAKDQIAELQAQMKILMDAQPPEVKRVRTVKE